MDFELFFSCLRPGESCFVQQSRVSRTAIGQHERSVEENDTLGIANRSRKWAKAPKERRRSHKRPCVGQWIIDGALICPDCMKDSVGEVIFAALDNDPAIGKNGCRMIQRAIAVWQRSQMRHGYVQVPAKQLEAAFA